MMKREHFNKNSSVDLISKLLNQESTEWELVWTPKTKLAKIKLLIYLHLLRRLIGALDSERKPFWIFFWCVARKGHYVRNHLPLSQWVQKRKKRSIDYGLQMGQRKRSWRSEIFCWMKIWRLSILFIQVEDEQITQANKNFFF